jgi:hypothetical protein
MQYGLDVSITGEYAQANMLAELAALAEVSGWDGYFVQDGLLPALSETMVDPRLALCEIEHHRGCAWRSACLAAWPLVSHGRPSAVLSCIS